MSAKAYASAREADPNRCSGPTRNWTYITEGHLNPQTQTNQNQKYQLAA